MLFFFLCLRPFINVQSRLYIVSQVTGTSIYVKVTSMVLTLWSVLLCLVTVNTGFNSNLLELVLRNCSFNLFGFYVLFLIVFGCLLLRWSRSYVFLICFVWNGLPVDLVWYCFVTSWYNSSLSLVWSIVLNLVNVVVQNLCRIIVLNLVGILLSFVVVLFVIILVFARPFTGSLVRSQFNLF